MTNPLAHHVAQIEKIDKSTPIDAYDDIEVTSMRPIFEWETKPIEEWSTATKSFIRRLAVGAYKARLKRLANAESVVTVARPADQETR